MMQYKIATEKFLSNFNILWAETINTIGVHGSQLEIGNHLRPQICLWGYLATIDPNNIEMHDYSHIADVAVSIELIHKASLLIDDWIDNDSERHGKPAFHIEYGPHQAVLCALNLIGYAMSHLENAFSDNIVLPNNYYLCLNTVIKTVCSMAKGALEELRLGESESFIVGKVREITQLETGEIIGNSLLLGYYIGAEKKINSLIEERFRRIGDKCGYIFQAFNDLEAFVNPQKLTNHKGTLNYDFQLKRKNLVIATLYELSNEEDRKILLKADLSTILNLIRKYRIIATMRHELDNIFCDLMSESIFDSTYGISELWIAGFQHFMSSVKKIAENRLQ